MEKTDCFSYRGSYNTIIKGDFRIYQAINGKVCLFMGNNSVTQLTLKQIEELHIDVYSLVDFDYNDFKEAYHPE